MSPKAVNYKANSVVYFKGDVNEQVYILKSGRVVLKYNDIETGQELQDVIQTGEFFGVKSALGKYPREETAIVLQDSSMVRFTVPEFEEVAMKNTRIIMKMLKVFSNQLRRIHKQVRNLISTGEQANPEKGLFNIGQYYLNSKKYAQALYAFRRYLTYYPSGKFATEANEHVQLCEKYAQHGVRGAAAGAQESTAAAASFGGGGSGGAASSGQNKSMSDTAKEYYNAVSLFSQQQYEDALGEFKKIVNEGQDQEYAIKSLFEIGRCLYSLERYDECVRHYTTMIKKYPKHPELTDALYYIGSSYEKTGDTGKAGNFYKKILSMADEGKPIHRKARKALRTLEDN